MNEIDVPVAGGTLRALAWPGEGPVVVAVHGITANALSWAPVARELAGRVRLVAPDLRGRAKSAHLPPPYGMGSHAADVIALADHLGADTVTLVGHSMGAFVVTETVARHPERAGAVLMVDGGVPLPRPPGMDVDTALLATIGPAMRRLSMTFASLDDYIAYFRSNPALGEHWTDDLGAYVARDWTGTGSTCVLDAIRADAADMFTRPAAHDFPLLWAPRGLQDEDGGLYSAGDLSGVDATLVPDTNHYTIVMGAGAPRVAEAILKPAPGTAR
jgi:pimeloyl-ACP methyl ester carboxylesterase